MFLEHPTFNSAMLYYYLHAYSARFLVNISIKWHSEQVVLHVAMESYIDITFRCRNLHADIHICTITVFLENSCENADTIKWTAIRGEGMDGTLWQYAVI